MGTEGYGSILYVDDEADILMVAQRLLEVSGYQVRIAESGAEALEFLTMDPAGFRLLITDMAMPEMGGADLIASAREINPGLPVVICTAQPHTLSADLLEAVGANNVLHKPFPLNLLLDTVRSALT